MYAISVRRYCSLIIFVLFVDKIYRRNFYPWAHFQYVLISKLYELQKIIITND